MKRCTKCPPDNNMHPLSDFSRSGNTLKSACKPCTALYLKAYKSTNPELIKARKETATNIAFHKLMMAWSPAP